MSGPVVFNREAFLAGLKGAKEFKNVPPGMYNAALEKCYIGVSQAGRTQAVFGWRIAEDDESQGGQMHFVYLGLISPSGEPEEMGNKIFAATLAKLGLPFEYMEQNVDNLDKIMELLIGTEARLKLSLNEKNPDFTNTRIEKLLSSPLDGKPVNAPVPAVAAETMPEPVTTEDIPAAQKLPVKLEVNDSVVVTTKEGQLLAKVVGYIDATNQVVVKFNNKGPEAIPELVDASVCQKLTDAKPATSPKPATSTPAPAPTTPVVEAGDGVEEIQEIELKVGMEVKGLFGGKQAISGKIHRLDEAGGKVLINMGGKAYPCPIDTIELLNPVPF